MKWKFFDKTFDFRKDFNKLDEAWVGHIYFAYDLVRNVNPKKIVELGTFSGTSYFSFCQALKDGYLDAELIAVDTWRGDKHAGFYDEYLFNNFKKVLQSNYERINTCLLKKTFDEALRDIEDGSIDLLHIDGLHTHEGVKHDFESWLPKMSKEGIILFHDIVVKKNDFGVYRFWDELKKRYTTIEFHHSNGLGVLFLGDILFDDIQLGETALRKAYDLDHKLDLAAFEISNLIKSKNELEQEKDIQIREIIKEKDIQIRENENNIDALGKSLIEVHDSWSWRSTIIFRKLFFAFTNPKRMLKKYLIYRLPPEWQKMSFAYLVVIVRRYPFLQRFSFDNSRGKMSLGNNEYQEWIKLNTPSEEDFDGQHKRQSHFEYRPLISFIVPVYNVDEKWLRLCIESVIAQTYNHWELCIADDHSTMPHIKSVLDEYTEKDQRIKVVYRKENGHISAASNSALRIAKGEFIALLDNDDEITPDALFEVASVLNQDKNVDLLYSDEDKMELSGRRVDPYFKPGWDYDLLLSMNYITHLGVYRKTIIDEIGGFREGFEGSQDYDILLRFIEKTSEEKIVHIPKILYHWRKIPGSTAEKPDAKGYAYEIGRKALEEHLARTGTNQRVKIVSPGVYRIVGE